MSDRLSCFFFFLPSSSETNSLVNKKDPFSFGTRDCLGKNLAYSELRVAIARFLFRFDYELAPGQEDWMDKSRVIIVWEKGPLKVKLTERKLVPIEE